MDIVTVFIDYLDSLFYKGYAEQLAEENPTAYNWEFNEFCNIYNFLQYEK